MTREEIIEQLKLAIGLIKQDGKDWLDDRDIPMLEGCVKVLEQEQTNTNLMLMEANINGYTEGLKDSSKPETVTEFADRCRECGAKYGKLLKQKTGHWINMEISINGDMSAECDKCGCIVRNSFTNNAINYCPNCGAHMAEPRESEEI